MSTKSKPELIEDLKLFASRVAMLEEQRESQLQSGALLRAAMASTLDPMLTVTCDGIVQSASDSVERELGWTPDEIIGQNIKVIIPEPHQSNHDSYLSEYFRTGATNILGQTREFSAQRKDGTTFPCELTVWRVDVPGRERPWFTGIIRNITERRKTEEALRESREWFSTTLTSIGDGVIATDKDGCVSFMNPAAMRLTGWGDESRQRSILDVFDIINQHTRERVESPVTRVLREGKTVGLANHTVLRSKEGKEYNITDCGSPIHNLSGELIGVVLVFRDITEKYQAESQARLHQEELAHVMRLSTMGEMASGMAHELNQPLSAIATFSEACADMLHSGTSSKEEIIEILSKVSKQAQRAGDIIRRLRQFVSKREPQCTILSLNNAVRDVGNMISPELIDSSVRVVFDLTEALPPVRADLIQIEQVILNLARNGIEAMQNTDAEQRVLTLRTKTSDTGNAVVQVIDEGHGLSDDILARIFDPFFTTKENGMGIGLTISRSIIETYGGQLRVVSDGQQGLTFSFELPAVLEGDSE